MLWAVTELLWIPATFSSTGREKILDDFIAAESKINVIVTGDYTDDHVILETVIGKIFSMKGYHK